MIEGKRVFISGGAGFIGSGLVRRLLAAGNLVVVYDNCHRNALEYSGLLDHPDLRFVVGDVLDAARVERAMAGCDIVLHLAAIAGVDTVLTMPMTTMKVNMIGTYNVLEAALQQPALERFIDFSTSEVFGTYAYKVREDDVTTLGAVGEARWTYAVSKLATEHLAINYYRQFGMPVVCIRPFNVYGPWQVGEGAIHNFTVRALRNEDLTIHNDGSQIRAWCYIDDILDAVLLCLERPEAVGHSFNIGNPRSVCTIYDLARQIIRLSGSAAGLNFIDWPFPDVELRVPNTDKARRLLAFEPQIDLEDGLSRTIEWYRGHLYALPQPAVGVRVEA